MWMNLVNFYQFLSALLAWQWIELTHMNIRVVCHSRIAHICPKYFAQNTLDLICPDSFLVYKHRGSSVELAQQKLLGTLVQGPGRPDKVLCVEACFSAPMVPGALYEFQRSYSGELLGVCHTR